MDGEELPQITPSMLRNAEESCRRRLAHEVRGGKRHANRTADMRFAVSNRVEADARLAQAELGRPVPAAFAEPRELEPEQQELYRAAVRGYLDCFGATEGLVVDLGGWRTPVAGAGVELVANVGLPVELAGGGREIRRVYLGRRASWPLLDAADVQVALVRTEQWAPDRLDIVAVDVLEQRRIDRSAEGAELTAQREAAMAWIADRAARILELASDPRPRAGRDCAGCAFVSGCAAHAG